MNKNWVLVFCLIPGLLFAKSPVQVIVLTGQSNSLGTTADPAEPNAGPGGETEDQHIPFFWSNRSTRGGNGDAALIGDSGGAFRALQVQQGEGRNKRFWGPEIALGRYLHRAGLRDFVIIKASRGGGGNGHWLPDGEMYTHVLRTVEAARKAKAPDAVWNISHLLYVQGESDSAAEAALAGQRAGQLLDNLRASWPEAKNMKMIIGGIAASGGARDVVRNQQAGIAVKRADITYIDNLDLRPNLYDRLHFDRSAKQMLGFRFAQRIWAEQGRLKRVACIGDSITYGLGIKRRGTGNYPAQIQLQLGITWQVRAFGNPGRGVVQKSRRGNTPRAYIAQQEHTDALAWQPEVVVCNLGVNDLMDWERFGKTDFVHDYRALVADYKKLPSSPRILLWHRLAPLFPGQAFHGNPAVDDINEAIARVAQAEQLETVDMFAPLVAMGRHFPDHIHPDAVASGYIAKTVFEALIEE